MEDPNFESSPEETALSEKHLSPDEALQQEFNRWAEAGEGPKMEQHHLDMMEEKFQRLLHTVIRLCGYKLSTFRIALVNARASSSPSCR